MRIRKLNFTCMERQTVQIPTASNAWLLYMMGQTNLPISRMGPVLFLQERWSTVLVGLIANPRLTPWKFLELQPAKSAPSSGNTKPRTARATAPSAWICGPTKYGRMITRLAFQGRVWLSMRRMMLRNFWMSLKTKSPLEEGPVNGSWWSLLCCSHWFCWLVVAHFVPREG